MDCHCVTSENSEQYTRVASVSCKTPKGEIGIFKGHAEMFFLFDSGVLLTFEDETEKYLQTAHGYGHVVKDVVTLIYAQA